MLQPEQPAPASQKYPRLILLLLSAGCFCVAWYLIMIRQPHTCDPGQWFHVAQATNTDTTLLVLSDADPSSPVCIALAPPPGNYTINQPLFAWHCPDSRCVFDGPGELTTSPMWILGVFMCVLCSASLLIATLLWISFYCR